MLKKDLSAFMGTEMHPFKRLAAATCAAIAACLIASGCSSAPPKVASAKHHHRRPVDATFDQPNGSIKLSFDADGNFTALKSTSVAPILADTAAGDQAAITVAAAQAKRNIAEFLSNEIHSTKTITNLAKASDAGNSYAQEVTDRIGDNATALLRGAYISKQTLDQDTAKVEISITRETVNAAMDLAHAMRHGGFPDSSN